MKNQYVGDINDYLKYGLLRCFAEVGFHLGVCWMLTPNDRRRDGQKRAYLKDSSRWRSFDSPLFDALARVLTNHSARDVAGIQDAAILPNTRFHSDMLIDSPAHRSDYFGTARQRLIAADLWFFDPDNGLEVRSIPYGTKGSSKYLYWQELSAVWSRGVSLVVYQHFPREKRDQYIERRCQELRKHALGAILTVARTSNVLFLVACQQAHSSRLDKALDLVKWRWSTEVMVAAEPSAGADARTARAPQR